MIKYVSSYVQVKYVRIVHVSITRYYILLP